MHFTFFITKFSHYCVIRYDLKPVERYEKYRLNFFLLRSLRLKKLHEIKEHFFTFEISTANKNFTLLTIWNRKKTVTFPSVCFLHFFCIWTHIRILFALWHFKNLLFNRSHDSMLSREILNYNCIDFRSAGLIKHLNTRPIGVFCAEFAHFAFFIKYVYHTLDFCRLNDIDNFNHNKTAHQKPFWYCICDCLDCTVE